MTTSLHLTPDLARAYRCVLRFAVLDGPGQDARAVVLRELNPITGVGYLPNSAGVRELLERRYLVRLPDGRYRIATPNPHAGPEESNDRSLSAIAFDRRYSRGFAGPRHEDEALEARRPLYVKGKRSA